jgi:hypothetical protein
MARLSSDRISLARRFLYQFAELKRKDTTEVGWLMLKFSCTREEALQLVEAIEQEPDISYHHDQMKEPKK